MLKKTQGTTDVAASRILGKGPEFLRKQIERENEANKGRVSAVERLAATKPQYVKSQQTTSFEPGSVIGSSKAHDIPVNVEEPPTHEEENNVVRRISSKKRDSIFLYRQKCELLRGSPRVSGRPIKKSLLSIKNKANAHSEARGVEVDLEVNEREDGTSEECGKEVTSPGERNLPETAIPHRRVTETREQERKTRRGVARSSSDISSRYSKNFADFDAFFKYCGLDGDVIESLGKENFSARSNDLSIKIRSISASASDDGLSGSSGGLQEEELQETVRQGCSVIERNARIIKWLYSCRNAAESGKTLRDLN